MSAPIQSLRNLGPASAGWLRSVGVATVDDLKRLGAVAMNVQAGSTPLVLLCPAWKRWGTANTVKPGTVILHGRDDDVIPFPDSEELVRNSGLSASAVVEVGNDHQLADPEPLAAMRKACERMRIEQARA